METLPLVTEGYGAISGPGNIKNASKNRSGRVLG
jgi:hypothetical protein